jgi:hypothetical protein
MQEETILMVIRVDLFIEALAGIIALMVSLYANNAFRLTRQKRLSDLSTGFLVLSLGMLGRVVGTLFFFVSGITSPRALGIAIVILGVMKIMAYTIFAFSMFRGRTDGQMEVAMLVTLPFLTSPGLDVVAIMILCVVVLQTIWNYVSVRTRYAFYVLVGFSLLLLSSVLGMTDVVNASTYMIYLASQLAQFLGLISFLVMLRQAQKDE